MSVRKWLPFDLLLEGVEVGTTSSNLEMLIKVTSAVEPALPVLPVYPKDTLAHV